MRSLPFVASFVVHGGALFALCLTCVRSRPEPERAATLLCIQDMEDDASPEIAEPVEVEPLEPAKVEPAIEPEPLPDVPEPIDFDLCVTDDPSPKPLPFLKTPVRIAPLRRPIPASQAAPVPASAPPPRPAHATRVTTAVPRGDRCVPPRYPTSAQRLGQEGHVLLVVRVGADGTALSVEIEESSGHPILDEAAAAAVRQWIFEPAREDGRAVESVVHVPFRFRLRA